MLRGFSLLLLLLSVAAHAGSQGPTGYGTATNNAGNSGNESWNTSNTGLAFGPIVWANVGNAVDSGGGTMTKTAGGSAWSAGGYNSAYDIVKAGWGSVCATPNAADGAFALGIEHASGSAGDYTTLDFSFATGLACGTSNQFCFLEHGTAPGGVHTFVDGDLLCVVNSGGAITVTGANRVLGAIYTTSGVIRTATISAPYNTAPLALGETSDWLVFDHFGFSIPLGVQISGIYVEIEDYASLSSGTHNILDADVKIEKAGTVGGTNMASATKWPLNASKAYVGYGGSASLWGLTFSPSDINASNFGVAISGSLTGTTAQTGYVDAVRITVYYATGGSQMMMVF